MSDRLRHVPKENRPTPLSNEGGETVLATPEEQIHAIRMLFLSSEIPWNKVHDSLTIYNQKFGSRINPRKADIFKREIVGSFTQKENDTEKKYDLVKLENQNGDSLIAVVDAETQFPIDFNAHVSNLDLPFYKTGDDSLTSTEKDKADIILNRLLLGPDTPYPFVYKGTTAEGKAVADAFANLLNDKEEKVQKKAG